MPAGLDGEETAWFTSWEVRKTVVLKGLVFKAVQKCRLWRPWSRRTKFRLVRTKKKFCQFANCQQCPCPIPKLTKDQQIVDILIHIIIQARYPNLLALSLALLAGNIYNNKAYGHIGNNFKCAVVKSRANSIQFSLQPSAPQITQSRILRPMPFLQGIICRTFQKLQLLTPQYQQIWWWLATAKQIDSSCLGLACISSVVCVLIKLIQLHKIYFQVLT